MTFPTAKDLAPAAQMVAGLDERSADAWLVARACDALDDLHILDLPFFGARRRAYARALSPKEVLQLTNLPHLDHRARDAQRAKRETSA